MAVYVSLTAAVVWLGMLVKNQDYVKLHTRPQVRENRLQGGYSRQQAWNIGIAVMIFFLLTGVSACRIAVGNDYWVYRFQFNLIMQNRLVSYEGGFNLVVWILQFLLGYDNYLPVFAFFSIVTCSFFVKAVYYQAEWFGGTIFLLMTGGYYFSSLNSVRYYLVLAVALYSIKYIFQRQYFKFLLWIIAASFFHKSVLLVIPVYLLAWWLANIKLKRWHYLLAAVVVSSLVLGEKVWRKVIFFFYPFYEGSVFDVRNMSFTNIAKCIGVLILCLICYRKGICWHITNRFYFFLNIGGLFLYTFGSFIPEVSRIGYYFIASQIFLVPALLKNMEKGILRYLCIIAVSTAFLLYFAMFLYQAYDINIRLLPYRTWLFD